MRSAMGLFGSVMGVSSTKHPSSCELMIVFVSGTVSWLELAALKVRQRASKHWSASNATHGCRLFIGHNPTSTTDLPSDADISIAEQPRQRLSHCARHGYHSCVIAMPQLSPSQSKSIQTLNYYYSFKKLLTRTHSL